jgi:hypothetical protein
MKRKILFAMLALGASIALMMSGCSKPGDSVDDPTAHADSWLRPTFASITIVDTEATVTFTVSNSADRYRITAYQLNLAMDDDSVYKIPTLLSSIQPQASGIEQSVIINQAEAPEIFSRLEYMAANSIPVKISVVPGSVKVALTTAPDPNAANDSYLTLAFVTNALATYPFNTTTITFLATNTHLTQQITSYQFEIEVDDGSRYRSEVITDPINPNVPLYTTITVTHADGSNAPGGNAVHIFERLVIMYLLIGATNPITAHVVPGSVQLAP